MNKLYRKVWVEIGGGVRHKQDVPVEPVGTITKHGDGDRRIDLPDDSEMPDGKYGIFLLEADDE